MKVKTTRICARNGCNNEFKLYKSTDKFCSPACAYSEVKPKPTKQYKINQKSVKLKKELYVYSKLRKEFLAKPENKYCPVCKVVFNKFVLASEIHHLKGRTGKLLNNTTFWLAVSRIGHDWIHSHPEQSYKLNFLISSNSK